MTLEFTFLRCRRTAAHMMSCNRFRLEQGLWIKAKSAHMGNRLLDLEALNILLLLNVRETALSKIIGV